MKHHQLHLKQIHLIPSQNLNHQSHLLPGISSPQRYPMAFKELSQRCSYLFENWLREKFNHDITVKWLLKLGNEGLVSALGRQTSHNSFAQDSAQDLGEILVSVPTWIKGMMKWLSHPLPSSSDTVSEE